MANIHFDYRWLTPAGFAAVMAADEVMTAKLCMYGLTEAEIDAVKTDVSKRAASGVLSYAQLMDNVMFDLAQGKKVPGMAGYGEG